MLSSISELSTKAIAFIDAAVPDCQTLIEGASPEIEVIKLESNRSAIEQITEALQGKIFSTIHIISHGQPGCLQLGNIELTWDKLRDSSSDFSLAIQEWGRSLAFQAEILIYGCNVGKGNIGKAFIAKLSQLTGASVAASENLTGSQELGGDWKLTATVGKIQAAIAFRPEVMAAYSHVLNTFKQPPLILTTGTRPSAIVSQDFNGDGLADLAVANSSLNDGSVSIFLGTGQGNFGPATNFPVGNGRLPRGIVAGNFNGDTLPDLAVSTIIAGDLGGEVYVFLGTGQGNFDDGTNFGGGARQEAITAGDFNQDGFADLVVAETDRAAIALGTGQGTFGNFNTVGTATSPRSLEIGDFNADNNLDVVVSNGGLDPSISIFFGTGQGTFGTSVSLLNVAPSASSIAVADFNADGRSDLALTRGQNVSILLATGPGTFSNPANFNAGLDPNDIAVGDFNADGQLDLAVANLDVVTFSNEVSILTGTGQGTFNGPFNYKTGGDTPSALASGDFNFDSRQDIAVINTNSQNVSILLNLLLKASFVNSEYSSAEGDADATVNIPVTVEDGLRFADLIIPIATALPVPAGTSQATQGSDYTLATNTLTFPAGSGSSTQNLAVTIKPDNLAEIDEAVIFSFGTSPGGFGGTSPGGFGGSIPETTITIPANDPIIYTVGASAGTIPEGDSGVNPLIFTVSRSGGTDSAGTVNYAIGGTASNGSDYNNIGGTSGGTSTTGLINFAGGKTSKTVTLDVLGDGSVEPDETITVTLSNPVTLPNGGLPSGSSTIGTATATTTVINDDRPGITVNPITGLVTTEAGGTATFTITLNSQPTASVTVGLSSSNPAEGTVSTPTITFTPANWNQPQTVTVTGVDDNVADGNIAYNIVTAAATSTDNNYNNLNPADVSLTNTDSNAAGITVNPASTTATEGGANGSYTIQLNSQPTAQVTVSFAAGNQISTIAPINFDAANWNIAQTVTVIAADDAVVEGTHSGTINHSVTSTDGKYNGSAIGPINVAITDNDLTPPTPTPPTPTPPTPTPPTPTPPTPIPPTPIPPTPTPPTPPTPTLPTPTPSITPTPTPSTTPTTDIKNTWCGLEAGLDKLENILDNQLQTIKLPIVGSLKNLAPNFIDSFKNKLVDVVKNGIDRTTDNLETSIRNVLGSEFKVKVDRTSSQDENTLLINIGKAYQIADANISQNLGLPELGFSTDGKAKSPANFDLSIAAGVHKDFGCFIDTNKTKLTANFDTGIDDKFQAKGNLGVVQLDLNNLAQNPTKAEAKLAVNLKDLDNLGGNDDGSRLTLSELKGNYQLSDLFDANLTANANLGLQAKTSINDNPAFPSLGFDLGINWPIVNYANGQLTTPQQPTVKLGNVSFEWGQTLEKLGEKIDLLQDNLNRNLLDVDLPILGKLKDVIPGDSNVFSFANAVKNNTVNELKSLSVSSLTATLESLIQDSIAGNFNPAVFGSKLTSEFSQRFSQKLASDLQESLRQYFPESGSIAILPSFFRGFRLPKPNLKVIGNGTPDDLNLQISLDRNYQFPDVNLSGDLGIPALGLNVNGKAQSKFDGNLSLGFGINKDFGFYVDTDKTKLAANVSASLDDNFTAQGKLGFFQIDLTNDAKNPTKAEAKFSAKLNDLDNLGGNDDGSRLTFSELTGNNQFSDLFNATLNSSANLGLAAKTSINGNAAIPSFNFDLGVNWPIVNYSNGQFTGPQTPTVDLNNVKLDLGTFVSKFAKPAIGKISDVLQPFKPVTKLLNSDTKLISQIGLGKFFDINKDGKVTLLDIAGKLSGKNIDTRFLDSIDKIDKLGQLLQQISTVDGGVFLDLGSYSLGNLNADRAISSTENAVILKKDFSPNAVQQINSKTGGKVKEFLNNLTGLEGLDIPLLTKPMNAVQLLLGKPDVNLFTYKMPKLGIDFSVDKEFPIWGPISGLLEGKFSASANLGFGYDTYGLQQWKQSNFSASSAPKVFNGFYVSDRENADGTGRDVDELKLNASIAAGAGIDLKVVSGYLKGGIAGNVGIDLRDVGESQPKRGGDGKIRASEISSRISKPSELFNVTGNIEAFLGAKIKTVTWKVWEGKKTVYDKNFATFKLADFNLDSSSSKKGNATNAYIIGGTVFFDANFNGLQDENEPFTITNADGSFDLEVSLEDFDRNNSGDLEPEEGRIVIAGGINTSTNLPQQSPLFATPDATAVTPLTTLITELVEQGFDQNDAANRVKSALGIPSEIDLTSYDPLQAMSQNDPKGLTVYAAHASLQNTIVLVTDLVSAAANTAKNEIADRTISTIADLIKSNTLDLSNSAQLQAIVQFVASQMQAPQISSIAPDAAQIIAGVNQRIGAIAASNLSLSDAAVQIATVQFVAQGEVAKDLQEVVRGNKTIQEAIAENTGRSLDAQINSTTVNNPTIRNSANSDFTEPELFPESGIEFTNNSPDRQIGTDGDDTLGGDSSNDVFSGKKGNDLIFGFNGNDWINGNPGNDLIYGGFDGDTIYGGKGIDSITGSDGGDIIFGNRGDDLLDGSTGNDTLLGGNGNDTIIGGDGDDFLNGEIGDDSLIGGNGTDRFLISANSGSDIIFDFADGIDFIALGNGLTFSQLSITDSSNATLIRLTATNEILATLNGVNANQISIADFS